MKNLEFNGVSFGYPEQAPILSGINLTLNQGERLLILGANGSGKSTIAYLAAGIISPTHGGITNFMESSQEYKQNIGFVFQNSRSQMVGATVEEDLAFGLTVLQMPANQIKDKVEKYLQLFGLTDKRVSNINQLSGGELRRLALAGVLITEPRLLILDEPLAMLDYSNQAVLLDYLSSLLPKETTVLWLDHDLRNLKYSDTWYLLTNEGFLQKISLEEISSEEFIRKHNLEPTPLQFLEWKFSDSVSDAIFGPECIKVKND